MVDLVKKQILQLEKENQNWIIEGFPRTRVQAMSLQKLGIIPDKFILLDVKAVVSQTQIKYAPRTYAS